MHVDAATLADLEVLHAADGTEGLFQLLNRTGTTRGRLALRRRIEHPLSDLRALWVTQDAVRFFMRHPLQRIDERLLKAVERYLGSGIEISTRFPLGERLEYLWVATRYRDIAKELRGGVDATESFFRYLTTVVRSVETRAPPALIVQLLAALQDGADMIAAQQADSRTVIGRDRAYRGRFRDRIVRALEALGELDALHAMAVATEELGWAMPEFVESDGFLLEAEGVSHPYVKEPVANPVSLSGEDRMIFLTGPNMAGKTTYLRSIALVVLLAHVGMGVPATSVRLAPVEALFTSLNRTDDLKAGLSYFLAEVHRVKAAASLVADGRKSLVLFDEVFKGTNVKDAVETSAAVIMGFAQARRSAFVFASHLAELVRVLETDASIRFCCFDGEMVNGTAHYTYRLRQGVSDRRLGLVLLRQAGVLELLSQAAQAARPV